MSKADIIYWLNPWWDWKWVWTGNGSVEANDDRTRCRRYLRVQKARRGGCEEAVGGILAYNKWKQNWAEWPNGDVSHWYWVGENREGKKAAGSESSKRRRKSESCIMNFYNFYNY